jgi:hypothetical protein|tara:strand:+ start:427 stop:813 length:387 start_codon:yes stop_codon:yes gene_type:complete
MEIIMTKRKMLAKVEICAKYEIKASKLEYHIKKDSFPKGEIINGMRYFSEAELEKYAQANKAFKKPSATEIGKAEALDYVNNQAQPETMDFMNNVWNNVTPEPWYVEYRNMIITIGVAAVCGFVWGMM